MELEVDAVTVERGARRVLDSVSLTVRPGEIVAVIGPNGAGKTSLLDAVLGLLRLSGGAVRFAGRALRGLADRACVFSSMPDEAEPPAEVRVATLLAHAERFGRPGAGLGAELAERLGLDAFRDVRAGSLSRGEKRRVTLFTALCTSRPIVVLDEPLAAFDPLQLLDVLAILRERADDGTGLLMSVQQMADAEKIASRLLLLDAGRAVAFGTLAELRARIGDPGASLEHVFLRLLREARSDARP